MEEISRQLLFQRIRNRVIETLEMISCLEDVAKYGAFWIINTTDFLVPSDFDGCPGVFNEAERVAVERLWVLLDQVSIATPDDFFDVDRFKASSEWGALESYAGEALQLFMRRGRFSEDVEEASLI